MSVLVSKRRESKIEAVTYAFEVQKMLIEFMQRNFGIRDVNHVVRMKYAFSREPTENFHKYWYLMHSHKTEIHKRTILLTNNIYAAYKLYPSNLKELEQRSEYQTAAKIECEIIIKELQVIAEIFDVDLNLFEPSVKALTREKFLIKKWKKLNNKIKRALQKS